MKKSACLFLSGIMAFSGCVLPSQKSSGQGYFGNFERTVPPDNGKEYSAGEIPSGWKIYERQSTRPEGHVDEKRGVYIEDRYLCVVGVSDLWEVNGNEQSAIRDAERNASISYARIVHDSDGDGNFEGMTSGILSEANELVIVKKGEEVALVAEVRCTVRLDRLPSDTKRIVEEMCGGR